MRLRMQNDIHLGTRRMVVTKLFGTYDSFAYKFPIAPV